MTSSPNLFGVVIVAIRSFKRTKHLNTSSRPTLESNSMYVARRKQRFKNERLNGLDANAGINNGTPSQQVDVESLILLL